MRLESAARLNCWLADQDDVFEHASSGLSTSLVCHILARELGGPNDDLARFLYADDLGRKVARPSLQAETIWAGNALAVRITSQESNRLRLTIPHLAEVVECQGTQLLIRPEAVARQIRDCGLRPVIVKRWAQQVAFSTFDLTTTPYQDQLWVLRNNDAALFAHLIANEQIVFQGIHDLIGHIAGLNREGYLYAAKVAKEVDARFQKYFGPTMKGNLPSHLIPFAIGLLLDDLTQMPFYKTETRAIAIEVLLDALEQSAIDPREKLLLTAFPKQVITVLNVVREAGTFSKTRVKQAVAELTTECRALTMA